MLEEELFWQLLFFSYSGNTRKRYIFLFATHDNSDEHTCDTWDPTDLWSGRTTMNLNIALCNKGWHFWKGGFVTDKTGLKIFVFINAMIFAFTTFVTNTPLYGKIASKVWKIYFQIYHLIFCMLQAAKYLIYDYFYFLILLFFLP